MVFFRLALVASALLVAVNATPTGAPETCCDNMLPQHGAFPQSDPAPYALRAAKNADDTFTGENRHSLNSFVADLAMATVQNM